MSPRPLVVAIDLALVAVFAAIGRASHAEALDPVGLARTAWPFLVAALAGSLLGHFLGRGSWWREGLIVWALTVSGGVALRLAGGDSAAPGFVLVTTAALAGLLLGWRGLARLSRSAIRSR